MEDHEIIELYWQRDEAAVFRTRERYGARLRGVAYGILKNNEDAEESENDTYLKAWQTIPPQRPNHFFAYLAKICRNLSLNRLEWLNTQKRGAGQELTAELDRAVPDEAAARIYEAEELGMVLSDFLRTLSRENRIIFIRRYLFADSVRDVARLLGVSESKVKSSLFRTRNSLRSYLEKEEIV